MKNITVYSKTYMNSIKKCFIDIGSENCFVSYYRINATDYAVLPDYLMLPSQLAKLMLSIIVEDNEFVKGLPDAQRVILKFIPYSFEFLIKEKIRFYFKQNNKLNIEGFVKFRLKDIKEILDAIIGKIIKSYVIQKKYDCFLSMMKAYIEENDPVADEMHILPKSKLINSDDTFEILIEFLPRKLIIYDVERFPDKNLLRSIEYVFDKRIIYQWSSCET